MIVLLIDMSCLIRFYGFSNENSGYCKRKFRYKRIQKKEHKEPYPIDPLFWSYLYDSISRKECGLGKTPASHAVPRLKMMTSDDINSEY